MKYLIVHLKPISINHYYGYRKYKNKLIKYVTPAGKQFKDSLAYQWIAEHGKTLIDKPIKMEIKLYFSDNRKRDVDNYNKGILDSLKKVAYMDDDLIHILNIQKFSCNMDFITIEITDLTKEV